MAAHTQHAQQGRLLPCVTFALIYRCQVIKKRMNTYRKEERDGQTQTLMNITGNPGSSVTAKGRRKKLNKEKNSLNTEEK